MCENNRGCCVGSAEEMLFDMFIGFTRELFPPEGCLRGYADDINEYVRCLIQRSNRLTGLEKDIQTLRDEVEHSHHIIDADDIEFKGMTEQLDAANASQSKMAREITDLKAQLNFANEEGRQLCVTMNNLLKTNSVLSKEGDLLKNDCKVADNSYEVLAVQLKVTEQEVTAQNNENRKLFNENKQLCNECNAMKARVESLTKSIYTKPAGYDCCNVAQVTDGKYHSMECLDDLDKVVPCPVNVPIVECEVPFKVSVPIEGCQCCDCEEMRSARKERDAGYITPRDNH